MLSQLSMNLSQEVFNCQRMGWSYRAKKKAEPRGFFVDASFPEVTNLSLKVTKWRING